MGKLTPHKVRTLAICMTGLGLISLGLYIVTYIQYYDDIGSLEKKGDNTDGDYVYNTADEALGLWLQIEIIGAFLFAFGGFAGIIGHRSKSAVAALLVINFLALGAFGTSAFARSLKLWGSDEGSCNYFGDPAIHGTTGDYVKACPTTRHENQRPTPSSGYWNISLSEPLSKSDCIFWFWDNTPTLESLMENPPSIAKKESLRNELLENMNWADKKNYGYTEVDEPCVSGNNQPIDCLPDGRSAYQQIQERSKPPTNQYGLTIVRELKQKPDITFCYYWGCNRVCNEHRYRINRILHYAALSFAAFGGIFFIISCYYSSSPKVGFNAGKNSLKNTLPVVQTEKDNPQQLKKKWRPMNVKSTPIKKRRLGDSRTLRF